jgi:LAO/AO transport system ATPase
MVLRSQSNDITVLMQRLTQGDRAALSRLLTLANSADHLAAVKEALEQRYAGGPPVIGITGSAGVGKSSLLGALAARFAERGVRVGILACDPESPLTGGALLGDRIRILGAAASPEAFERIFVRSLSTASGQQALSPNIDLMLRAMKTFGFDQIFVETVGAGQGDIAIREVADVVVLVLQPQAGDELQWQKAGLLEIADVFVINKADLPGSDRTFVEVTEQLHTAKEPSAPVVKTSIARNEGLDEFCRAIELAQASLKLRR